MANKLWWEFWPDQSAAAELEASLARMQFDYVDVIYANPPPDGLELEELVTSVAGLVAAGKARAWAIVNWTADALLEASTIATRLGLPQPCAAQLPYSVVHRSPVENPAMRRRARRVRRAGGRVVRARGRRAHRQVRPRPERRPRRPANLGDPR